MTNEEAVRKLEYSKAAYQMLIDEKVDSGKLVGKDVKGEWKADTPLDEAYKSMIEALEMGIKAIKALGQQPCSDAISRENAIIRISWDFPTLEISKVKESLDKLPSVNPQPCGDAIDRAEAIKIASGYCHPANVAKELAKMPPVTPQPKTGHREYNDIYDHYLCGNCKTVVMDYDNYCPNCGCRMVEPQERSGEE